MFFFFSFGLLEFRIRPLSGTKKRVRYQLFLFVYTLDQGYITLSMLKKTARRLRHSMMGTCPRMNHEFFLLAAPCLSAVRLRHIYVMHA